MVLVITMTASITDLILHWASGFPFNPRCHRLTVAQGEQSLAGNTGWLSD